MLGYLAFIVGNLSLILKLKRNILKAAEEKDTLKKFLD